MHLTRFTDYGLRVLMYAALKPADEKSQIAEVSESFSISRNHVMKVVNKLANEGFIKTIRGKGGGFQLGRSSADIRVGEVVRVLEESLEIIDCVAEGCSILPSCRLKGALIKAREAFMDELDKYTLEDLTAPATPLKQLLHL